MHELLLFSQSEALLQHWKKSLKGRALMLRSESELYEALDEKRSQIILYDLQSFLEGLDALMPRLEERKTALFALTGRPTFEEGSKLLPLKIAAYGNSYMSCGNLQLALEVIAEGKVWLYPDFIQRLISEHAKHSPIPSVELDKLTPKERDVASLLAQSKSNKEIASALDITERTVKAHLTHIYAKLQISDRLSLAMILKG